MPELSFFIITLLFYLIRFFRESLSKPGRFMTFYPLFYFHPSEDQECGHTDQPKPKPNIPRE